MVDGLYSNKLRSGMFKKKTPPMLPPTLKFRRTRKLRRAGKTRGKTSYIEEVRTKKKSKGIILPLTFSYGLKLTIVKIRRRFLKSKWQYTTAITILLAIITATILIQMHYSTKAATYTFTQTQWLASSTSSATHPGDRNNWTSFYSKEGIATGTELTLIRESN